MSVEAELSAARARGDHDRVAALLTRSATALVEAGRMDDARRRLDEAARLHGEAGRAVDEARCLCFAATLCRASGKLDLALSRATRAETIAPPATAAIVSAATERGEIALARQEFAEAAACYQRALAEGVTAGLVDTAQAALARKRAQALAAAGEVEPAIAALELAIDRYRAGGDDHEARRTRVELATAMQELGRTADALALAAELADDATASGDAWVLADLSLLAASRALDEGDSTAAARHARTAREHALASTHAIAYVSAALALAELAEAAGDRVAAYEALAVGWATLGDLLGDDAARATFAPKLEAQRERWGDDGFIEARDAYYEARKSVTTPQA